MLSLKKEFQTLILGLNLMLAIKKENHKLNSHLFQFYKVELQHKQDKLKAYLLKESWVCQQQEVIVDHIL